MFKKQLLAALVLMSFCLAQPARAEDNDQPPAAETPEKRVPPPDGTRQDGNTPAAEHRQNEEAHKRNEERRQRHEERKKERREAREQRREDREQRREDRREDRQQRREDRQQDRQQRSDDRGH